MACGATLKRSMEFEALLSPQSPKRRRCNPLPGTPSAPSPQRCSLRAPVDSSPASPPAVGGEHRLTPGVEPRGVRGGRGGVMGEGGYGGGGGEWEYASDYWDYPEESRGGGGSEVGWIRWVQWGWGGLWDYFPCYGCSKEKKKWGVGWEATVPDLSTWDDASCPEESPSWILDSHLSRVFSCLMFLPFRTTIVLVGGWWWGVTRLCTTPYHSPSCSSAGWEDQSPRWAESWFKI